MERRVRYKTLQCFLAALTMVAFLAPAAYASVHRTHMRQAQTLFRKIYWQNGSRRLCRDFGIAAAICGSFTGIRHAVKRKTRASVLTIVLFASQIIAAWMLGFLTVV